MPSNVFVQVIGFRDVERHALNTVFRLSWDRETSYFLWTPDAPLPAQLALIDVDSYEGAMALSSPEFNPNLKMICIGEGAPAMAWRVFRRPLQWPAVVSAMDALFAPVAATSTDLAAAADLAASPAANLSANHFVNFSVSASLPPGVKVSLLVDPSREHRLYLRARLALAGLLAVDEAETAEQGLALAKRRRYDLVIVNLDPPSQSGWKIIDQLVALEPNVGAVVITTHQLARRVREQAELAGCRGALAIPFDPGQVLMILQKV